MSGEQSEDSSSGSPLPVRRRARQGIEPETGVSNEIPHPEAKARRLLKPTGESTKKAPRTRQPRVKKGLKKASRGVYKPPPSRKADPNHVRWQRQKDKEHIAEFTRTYDDSTDEDRQTLRRERIRELKKRVEKLEGRQYRRSNSNRSRPHSKHITATSPPSRRREGGRALVGSGSRQRESRRDTGQGREARLPREQRVRGNERSRVKARGREKWADEADSVSFEDSAKLLLQSVMAKTPANGHLDNRNKVMSVASRGDETKLSRNGLAEYNRKPQQKQALDPVEAKDKKTRRPKGGVISLPSAKPTASGSSANKAGVLFSLLEEYKKQKSGRRNQAIAFNELASRAIPTMGKQGAARESRDSSRKAEFRSHTDHQKLYDVAKRMESRLRGLEKEEWKTALANHAAEAASVRSDLRDVYVDIVMRAPTFALAKNIALRVWMTYYREIQRVKSTMRPRGPQEGVEKLSLILEDGKKFFNGFIECVCVRFNLYPKQRVEDRSDDLERERSSLKEFLIRQYGKPDESEGKRMARAIGRIVSELYMSLGDMERYKAKFVVNHNKENSQKNKSEVKACVTRAKVLYNLAALTTPGYGKAHNQLAMLAGSDYLEAIFQYCLSIHSIEAFPAQENLLAAFEGSRKGYEKLMASNLPKDPAARRRVILPRFAISLVRLAGVLYTKIDMERAAGIFNECIKAYRWCLESKQVTDGILMRVVVLCIVLAQKGRLAHNTPFHDPKTPLATSEKTENSSRHGHLMAGPKAAMSEITLVAMDLVFEIFGAAARKASGDLKILRFLAPLSALCLWISRNPFVLLETPSTERRREFLAALARIANGVTSIKSASVRPNTQALDLVLGFMPLGALPEFAARPPSPLRPLDGAFSKTDQKAKALGSWVVDSETEGIYTSRSSCTLKSKSLKKWRTVLTSQEIKIGDKSDSITLDSYSTKDNNFGVVIGVVPADFPEDTRLPIGWNVPGVALICGTGQILGGDGEPRPYTEPLSKEDIVGIVINPEDDGTIKFMRNGEDLGPAATGIGKGPFRLGVSLIKSRIVTLVPHGYKREAEKKVKKAFFDLKWQIRGIIAGAQSTLATDPATNRYLPHTKNQPQPAAESKKLGSEKLDSEKLGSEEKNLDSLRVGNNDGEDIKILDDDEDSDRQTDTEGQNESKVDDISALELKGKKGVLSGGDDLVAIARARAARARVEAESKEFQLVSNIMEAASSKTQNTQTGGVAAAAKAIKEELPLLILDLPNICMRHGNHQIFSCAGIQICIDYFKAKGFKRLVAFVPAHLLDYDHVGKHRALVRLGLETKKGAKTKMPDNVSLLLSLKEEGHVVPTPPQDYDDSYCIAYAHLHGGYVVTNDKYRDCGIPGVTREWLRAHLMTFTFVENEFIPNPDFKFKR
ncbi:hypothetical protein AAMO2058_001112000 [Amorphochlora amoebiformis]